jgi:YVTN family beta-propeller protein
MRDVMVVVQKGDHSLGYYDFVTGDEIGRTPLDAFPHEFALSPDRRFAFSCHFGLPLAEDRGPGGNTVSVVDLSTRLRVGTIDCGPWRRPHGIAFDGKGRLYVLSEGAGMLLIVDDPASGRIVRTIPTGGHGSHIVSVTGDGRLAFCSNMVSDTVTAVFPQEPERPAVVIPVGRRPEGSVFDADERNLFVVNRESAEISVIDTATLRLTRQIPTPPGPVRICADDEGGFIVPFYHRKAIGRFDHGGTCQALLEVPEAPISIAFHAPSRTILASMHGDAVVLVDQTSFKTKYTIRTRHDPDPMAIVPMDLVVA